MAEFIEIAKEIMVVLKNLKEVKAIAVGGGIVSGYPDRYSDVDIYCLSTRLPDIKNRKALLNKLKLERIKEQYSRKDWHFGQDLFSIKARLLVWII